MEEIVFKFSTYELFRRRRPHVLPQLVAISCLLFFKALSRPDIGFLGPLIYGLIAIFGLLVLQGAYLRFFGNAEEKITLNDGGIAYERPDKRPKVIPWTQVSRVDFREMKKQSWHFVKVCGAGTSISFDSTKGDYKKFKSIIAQRVDHSKCLWGRPSVGLWSGIFLAVNLGVLLYLIKDNSTWNFILVFLGVMNLIFGIGALWSYLTVYV